MVKKKLKDLFEPFIAIPYIFFKTVLSLLQLFWEELKIILEPFNPHEVETKVTIGKVEENETARDDETSEVYGFENTAIMDAEDEGEE